MRRIDQVEPKRDRWGVLDRVADAIESGEHLGAADE